MKLCENIERKLFLKKEKQNKTNQLQTALMRFRNFKVYTIPNQLLKRIQNWR